MIIKKPIILFLMGPTASGKTNLAIELCYHFPIEIISVDSAAIYLDMNIGTNKPSMEIRSNIPHYLLDFINPVKIYSISNFHKDAVIFIKKIIKKNKIPLLVGGSMLYFHVLLNGLKILPSSNMYIRQYVKEIAIKKGSKFLYNFFSKIDPITSKFIHPNDLQRTLRALEVFFITGNSLKNFKIKINSLLNYNILQFILIPSNKLPLKIQIRNRFKNMLRLGFEEEVQNLFLRKELNKNLPSMKCIGYRQMWDYLSGNICYENMILKVIYATQKLAKNQMTWLKKWKNAYFFNNERFEICQKKIIEIIYKNINY